MNERALSLVVRDMRRFRPELTLAQIRAIITNVLNSGIEPSDETGQDVWWAYERYLSDVVVP
jgi:hypothetical protein